MDNDIPQVEEIRKMRTSKQKKRLFNIIQEISRRRKQLDNWNKHYPYAYRPFSSERWKNIWWFTSERLNFLAFFDSWQNKIEKKVYKSPIKPCKTKSTEKGILFKTTAIKEWKQENSA